MRKVITTFAFGVLAACNAAGAPDGAVVGTWATLQSSGVCAVYTFRADGSLTYSDGATLNGGYAIDGETLLIAFDGRPTVAARYTIGRNPGNPPAFPAFDTLTIANDPTTDPPRDVTYGRHLCTP